MGRSWVPACAGTTAVDAAPAFDRTTAGLAYDLPPRSMGL